MLSKPTSRNSDCARLLSDLGRLNKDRVPQFQFIQVDDVVVVGALRSGRR